MVVFLVQARLGSRLWPPSPRKVLRRVRAWLEEQAGHLWLGCEADEVGGVAGLRVELYPRFGHLQVQAPGRGQLRLRAETDAVGPGFHVWLTKLARAMGIDLRLRWQEPERLPDAVFGDELDEVALERALLQAARERWGAELQARSELALPHGPLRLASAEPEDEELRSLFPWWSRGHDAIYYLHRALTLMWWELRWRVPESERENALLEHAHQMLLMARSVDPRLELPWPEWREMLEHLGIEGSITVEVGRAAATCGRLPYIGHHRGEGGPGSGSTR